LADLCRIAGVKGVRARLFLDAGVDSLEKLAPWEAEDLGEMLLECVQSPFFIGIVPWPEEAQFSIETVRRLPKILEH
jgi:hypothetical protein